MDDTTRFFTVYTGAANPAITFVTMRNGEPGRPMYNVPLRQALPTLRALNKTGSDIFFTVNVADGVGRRFENIVAARTFYADYDAGVPTEWDLEPAIIVESSPGKAQAYWPIVADYDVDERWHAAQRGLVWATGADRNVCDAARVLRVPGFVNHKYPDKPVTKLLRCGTERFFASDIEVAYEPIATPEGMAAGGVVTEVADAEKRARYEKWLRAAGAPPASSSGRLPVARNWLFRKAAAGVWDFALPAAIVADVLAGEIDDLHYDDAADFARDAQRYGSGTLGAAYMRLGPKSVQMVEA